MLTVKGFQVQSRRQVGCDVELVQDVILSLTRSWDKSKLSGLFTSAKRDVIVAIPISLESNEDSLG